MTERGEVLTEVPAICWYLSQRASHPLLFPHDPLAAARVLEWCNWLSGTVHAMAFGQVWRPHRFVTHEQLYSHIQAKGRADVVDHFAMIEGRLAGRDWAAGHAYSYADAYLTVFFRWGNRIGLDMRASHPSWSDHAERVAARSAVQRAMQRKASASGINPRARCYLTPKSWKNWEFQFHGSFAVDMEFRNFGVILLVDM